MRWRAFSDEAMKTVSAAALGLLLGHGTSEGETGVAADIAGSGIVRVPISGNDMVVLFVAAGEHGRDSPSRPPAGIQLAVG